MDGRRAALIGLICCLPVAGCASGGEQFTGSVTTTSPRLCIGAPDAAGDCFDAAPSIVSTLHVDECVVVTYRPREDPAPGPRGAATSVEPSVDC